MESPIFRTHLQTIRASAHLELNRRYQADRSNECWINDEIYTLFRQLHSVEILHRLGVSSTHIVANASVEDRQTVQLFYELTIHMCAERSWFMLHYSMTLPEQWCGLLAPDNDESLACLRRVVATAQTVLRAEACVNDTRHPERIAARSDKRNLQSVPLVRLVSSRSVRVPFYLLQVPSCHSVCFRR